MVRKYINRTSKRDEISAEDEWAHLTGAEDSEPLMKEEVMDVQDRSITFGDEKQKPKTHYEAVKIGARFAMDAAGNTGQYIKFVNAHIDNQKKEIDKIKKIKEKFDHEVKLLQSNKPKIAELDKKLLEEVDVKKAAKNLKQLLEYKNLTINKLDELKKEIAQVENDLLEQEKQIEKISEKLENKKSNEEIQTIKNNLEEFIQKYGTNNLSEILDVIKSAKNSKKINN